MDSNSNDIRYANETMSMAGTGRKLQELSEGLRKGRLSNNCKQTECTIVS